MSRACEVLNVSGQVRNLQNTVKIACDFVSVHNLADMAALVTDQRKHRLSGGESEDVLQLHTILWYAWQSASTFKQRDLGTRTGARKPHGESYDEHSPTYRKI